jgi:hypothetical protein
LLLSIGSILGTFVMDGNGGKEKGKERKGKERKKKKPPKEKDPAL